MDRDPTPVPSENGDDAVVTISDDDQEDAALHVAPAPEALSASSSTVEGCKRRRIMDLANSAPSGIVRTHDGRPASVIAVTPGGVAIPMVTAPVRLPPASRDTVVTAVRKIGGALSAEMG